MNAVEKYIEIAERFSMELGMRRHRDAMVAREIDDTHPQDNERLESLGEKALANQRKLFVIRNELDAATAATIDALKRVGADAAAVQRTTNAAWHYVGRFQDEWFACKAVLQILSSDEHGVSLRDTGIALGFSDDDLTSFVSRFSKSKKVTAKPIGKDPKNRNAKLYKLFDVLQNLEDFSPLSKAEKRSVSKHLEQVQRKPA